MIHIAAYRDSLHEQVDCRPGQTITAGSGPECTIRLNDPELASFHVEISASSDASDRARLTCLGRSCWLDDGRRLFQGESVELLRPTLVTLGGSLLDVMTEGEDLVPPTPLGAAREPGHEPVVHFDQLGKPPGSATVASWLTALSQLQRQTAASDELLRLAARLVCDPGGLDNGMILMDLGQGWKIAASHLPRAELGIGFHMRLVERAKAEKRSWFHETQSVRAAQVPLGYRAAATAPIFNASNEVVGVVYGSRTTHRRNQRQGIRALEAQWLQLVADAVSAGLARLESEAERTRKHVLLEQAFSPSLALELQRNPSILAGDEREITVLFVDLRNFTPLAERLESRDTYRLLSDWMNRATNCVMAEHGVVIDYYGDGLAAMWNAPTDQSDHPHRAVLAAEAILGELLEFNQHWTSLIGTPVGVGMGIHTGMAQVGNAGSQRRLKYGPRGSTVNLASRIEAASKQLGAPVVLTQAVQDRLPSTTVTRRLCRAKLPGVSEPQELYELISTNVLALPISEVERKLAYERALGSFEKGQLFDACEALVGLRKQGEGAAQCAQFLCERIAKAQAAIGPALHPLGVIELDK